MHGLLWQDEMHNIPAEKSGPALTKWVMQGLFHVLKARQRSNDTV